MKRIILIVVSLAIGLAVIVACAQPASPTATPPTVEEETEATEEISNGEALIIDRCSVCHSADRVFRANKTEAEWETTIDRMIGLGANVTDGEKTEMIDWLVSWEN